MSVTAQNVLSLQQFANEYGTSASYPGMTIQILRSHGRTS